MDKRVMGRACSTHGKVEMHKQFCLESLKSRDNSKDLGKNGKIILI
jgi:hypothetical protein